MEVLKRIQADPRTQSIPVVVLTSSSQECDVAECYRLGVNSYMESIKKCGALRGPSHLF